jgi:uncharacterized DUF497 family protein
VPPPRPFRLVHRSFRRIEFDPAKSEEVFELRGFDLAYVSRLFPGYVIEREDTRDLPEPRYQAIGELLGEVFFVVYARRGDTPAASSRPGSRSRTSGSSGMTSRADRRIVAADLSDPARGRFDQARAGRPDPRDREPRPEATPEDVEATRAELDEPKRRTRRRTG